MTTPAAPGIAAQAAAGQLLANLGNIQAGQTLDPAQIAALQAAARAIETLNQAFAAPAAPAAPAAQPWTRRRVMMLPFKCIYYTVAGGALAAKFVLTRVPLMTSALAADALIVGTEHEKHLLTLTAAATTAAGSWAILSQSRTPSATETSFGRIKEATRSGITGVAAQFSARQLNTSFPLSAENILPQTVAQAVNIASSGYNFTAQSLHNVTSLVVPESWQSILHIRMLGTALLTFYTVFNLLPNILSGNAAFGEPYGSSFKRVVQSLFIAWTTAMYTSLLQDFLPTKGQVQEQAVSYASYGISSAASLLSQVPVLGTVLKAGYEYALNPLITATNSLPTIASTSAQVMTSLYAYALAPLLNLIGNMLGDLPQLLGESMMSQLSEWYGKSYQAECFVGNTMCERPFVEAEFPNTDAVCPLERDVRGFYMKSSLHHDRFAAKQEVFEKLERMSYFSLNYKIQDCLIKTLTIDPTEMLQAMGVRAAIFPVIMLMPEFLIQKLMAVTPVTLLATGNQDLLIWFGAALLMRTILHRFRRP